MAPAGPNLNPNRREREGRVRLYDVAQARPARRTELAFHQEWPGMAPPLRANSPFSDLAFAPDGRRLAAVMTGAIVVWDAESGARQDFIRYIGGGSSDRLAISPDGRWIAATKGHSPRVMDLVPPGP